jgi:hypothetical protein
MEVGTELYRQGKTKVEVNRTTIIKSVRSYCKKYKLQTITCRPCKPKKKLSEKNRNARLRFCLQHRHTDWRKVMFTDRCKFFLQYPGVCVKKSAWRISGEPYEEYRVNKATTFNVYGGITCNGPTRLHVVAGTTNFNPVKKYKNNSGGDAKNVTSAAYHDVVKQTFLPDGTRLMGAKDWVMQQDNDPTHAKASHKAVKDYNQEQGASVVEILEAWPPNSPDLNIIENIWSLIHTKVAEQGCKTTHDFQAEVVKAFASLSKDYIDKLFNIMKKRIELCIAAEGGRIKY